jgi:conjugal transfer/entry exclusion protein
MDELTVVEIIYQIEKEIDQYQKEIENLCEHLTPTTPPVVKDKRKQEEVEQLQEIQQQVSIATDLFKNVAQLWKNLEEDQKVQKWAKEEERIIASIRDLKKRQNKMSITEHIKWVQDMKKL